MGRTVFVACKAMYSYQLKHQGKHSYFKSVKQPASHSGNFSVVGLEIK
jgi:hypothetical protein